MKPHAKNLGFTIIELLITMGIFSVLTSVVLANYFTFGANSEFVNASEDVVLSLRQAQVYGAGTKKSAGACSFDCAYGVHFAANTPHGFTSFVDTNNNGKYDAGEGTEAVIWNDAISVTGIKCGLITSDCVGDITNGAMMDVTFKRPSPDARISDLAFNGYKSGWITLSDANTGKTITIAISLAGQISVQ
ncbi:MAG: hypothetical protein A2481_01375 [Candidatus Yonathbacteria bacterium RIFOXYC2_FULL_47_9]|nr:MAG: hypothetical protein A2481_01375 [Candidatus Yonathbacteria bacterium RIFOXYC2_FULL_47_9]HAT68677.1 hypothetical protein [Candidatus Yonathbacteria bacterium]